VLREIMENDGIRVLTEEKVTEILGDEVVQGVTTNKRELSCDMVLMTLGVRPNIDLAKQMGLDVGSLKGIRTDDHMMTTEEGIYACGDCVESKDIITGDTTLNLLWPNAKRQGWVSGCNCGGQNRRFTGSFNVTCVEILGTYAVSVGIGAVGNVDGKQYQIVEKGDASSFYRLIMKDRKLLGLQLINKSEHGGRLFSKMLRKDDLLELGREVFNDKYLSIRPWNYWLNQYNLCKRGDHF
jgi:NAD(P)H-nitrite reductase large subunit